MKLLKLWNAQATMSIRRFSYLWNRYVFKQLISSRTVAWFLLAMIQTPDQALVQPTTQVSSPSYDSDIMSTNVEGNNNNCCWMMKSSNNYTISKNRRKTTGFTYGRCWGGTKHTIGTYEYIGSVWDWKLKLLWLQTISGPHDEDDEDPPGVHVQPAFREAILAAGFPRDALDMVAYLTDDIDEALEMLPVRVSLLFINDCKLNHHCDIGHMGSAWSRSTATRYRAGSTTITRLTVHAGTYRRKRTTFITCYYRGSFTTWRARYMHELGRMGMKAFTDVEP